MGSRNARCRRNTVSWFHGGCRPRRRFWLGVLPRRFLRPCDHRRHREAIEQEHPAVLLKVTRRCFVEWILLVRRIVSANPNFGGPIRHSRRDEMSLGQTPDAPEQVHVGESVDTFIGIAVDDLGRNVQDSSEHHPCSVPILATNVIGALFKEVRDVVGHTVWRGGSLKLGPNLQCLPTVIMWVIFVNERPSIDRRGTQTVTRQSENGWSSARAAKKSAAPNVRGRTHAILRHRSERHPIGVAVRARQRNNSHRGSSSGRAITVLDRPPTALNQPCVGGCDSP